MPSDPGGNLSGTDQQYQLHQRQWQRRRRWRKRQRERGRRGSEGRHLSDFYAYMPRHTYIFAPTGEIWIGDQCQFAVAEGAGDEEERRPRRSTTNGKQRSDANSWLDKHRPVEQMTWAPGLRLVVKDRLIAEGGWFEPRAATSSISTSRRCRSRRHRRADHLARPCAADLSRRCRPYHPWLAHRVQQPEEKINHALVLGGNQGIGKDTLLEPVKRAVGPWNFNEMSPNRHRAVQPASEGGGAADLGGARPR